MMFPSIRVEYGARSGLSCLRKRDKSTLAERVLDPMGEGLPKCLVLIRKYSLRSMGRNIDWKIYKIEFFIDCELLHLPDDINPISIRHHKCLSSLNLLSISWKAYGGNSNSNRFEGMSMELGTLCGLRSFIVIKGINPFVAEQLKNPQVLCTELSHFSSYMFLVEAEEKKKIIIIKKHSLPDLSALSLWCLSDCRFRIRAVVQIYLNYPALELYIKTLN